MGSKTGWIIAGIVGGVMVLALVLIIVIMAAGSESLTPPTLATTMEGVLELKTVSVSPSVVVGYEPTSPGNAGDDYAVALDLYRQQKGAILSAMKRAVDTTGKHNPGMLDVDTVSLLQRMHASLSSAAPKSQMDFVARHAADSLRVVAADCPLAEEVAGLYSHMSLLASAYEAKGNADGARKVMQDTFMMGWHFMQERAQGVLTLMAGVGVQEESIRKLMKYGNQPGYAEYLRALEPLKVSYGNKKSILAVTKPHPGDTFNLIENDKDRAWRVQAILALGILKHLGSLDGDARDPSTKQIVMTQGDSKHVRKLLARLKNSKDPMEALAARTADSLTPEQYAALGSKK